ncbi:phospholipase A2 [Streptomyces sp. 2224.1]|uniref:phospholipase A2 n=1 Tax=Streptomyces sp. 2224.1 TaxID=1881020 RepID=UPI00210BDC44|nr:phospholipase A2 [Streptomyces sp. 2224.1]
MRTSFGGVVLAGVLALGAAAPALAEAPAKAAVTTGPSAVARQISAADVAGPAVGGAYRLAKLKSLTSKGQASRDAWFKYLGLYRSGSNYFRFNWSTNGCNSSPEKLPGGYDFTYSCHRHDFGYRNYKTIVGKAAWRRDHKKRIDDVFLQDMRQACQYKPWADPLTPAMRKKMKAACLKSADKYYAAVRVLG